MMPLLVCGASAQNLSSSNHCAVELPSTHLVSRYCELLKPRRIVVVTTKNRQDNLKEQDLFATSLAVALNRCGTFDVVVGTERVTRNQSPLRTGTFDDYVLLKLAQKHGADCVLYCEIDPFCVYDPMQAGVSMLLIHAGEAVSLVMAKDFYDLRNEKLRKASQAKVNQADSSPALNVAAHSPSDFIDFAANRFSVGILSVW